MVSWTNPFTKVSSPKLKMTWNTILKNGTTSVLFNRPASSCRVWGGGASFILSSCCLLISSGGLRLSRSGHCRYVTWPRQPRIPAAVEVGALPVPECYMMDYPGVNPLTAKFFNLNFHPLEVVPRWRCRWSTTSSEWKLFRFDKMEVNCFQILLIDVTFYL